MRALSRLLALFQAYLYHTGRLNRIPGSHGTSDDEDEAKEGIASIVRALRNERPPEVSVQASS